MKHLAFKVPLYPLFRASFLLLQIMLSNLVGWYILDLEEEMNVLSWLLAEPRSFLEFTSYDCGLADTFDPELGFVLNEHVGYSRTDWRSCQMSDHGRLITVRRALTNECFAFICVR